MPTISLEQDASYRREATGYIEICRACKRDRVADTCECGAKFERLGRSFFALQWTPTSLEVRMPDICPHCEQKATRMRSVTMYLPTDTRGRSARKSIEVPSCARMLPPFLAYLLLLTAIFWTVVFGFAAVFGKGAPAMIGTVLAGAATIAAWRAYGWFRIARFDHRSLRFRARRRGYADKLAELNNGRVL